MLAAPDLLYMSDVAADGNHVAGIAGGNLYFFELPASFPEAPPNYITLRDREQLEILQRRHRTAQGWRTPAASIRRSG